MTLLALLGLLLLAWAWLDGTAARERVLQQTRESCEELGLLLLDQSVVLEGIRPIRRPTGRLGLLRRYRFEFSRDGSERHTGRVALNGPRIEGLQFLLPDGVLHAPPRGQVIRGPWSSASEEP